MPSDNEAVVPRNSSAYYPPPDEIDPYSPINLNVLRDAPGGGKPLYSYSTLIRYAIKGSPEGRLLLEEIYYAIEQRFPWFKTAPPGWKNSIRHNLSLNACFEKVPRPLTDRGKGSYWTVNDSIDPKQGIHRVRRRRKAGKATTPTPTYQPAFPGYATGAADGTGFDPYAMYPYGYDASMYPPPFFPPGSGPDMTGNTVSGFEGSAEMGLGEGSATVVDWRAAFFGELERLKSMTKEQDKQGAPAEWYRMMLHRLRMGMWGIPALGTPMVAGAEGQSSEQAGGGLDDDGEDEDE